MHIPKTIEWISESPTTVIPGYVRLIDQTALPQALEFVETDDIETIWKAIKTLQVRGAPAIGIAAAMGLAANIQHSALEGDALIAEINRGADYLATARPTAVNLFWALDRMRNVTHANAPLPPNTLKARLAREAISIRDEDAAMCRAIGHHGATLLHNGDTVLTHCNAGSLATAEFGTALAPIYTAAEDGKRIAVYADETRPLLQGSRLTAWELQQAGIDVTVICDNMAAHVMHAGRIQAVMVGADRIAANGDTANKIGTYALALAAQAHNIPFYVLAPTSTIDANTPTGNTIPIEERSADEITMCFGTRTAPDGINTYAPAFDITPAALISAIICERDILRPDYTQSLATLT